MSRHPIKILYVEDEASVRELLSRFISRFATKLYQAQDGKEALKLYKEHKPDIVISDIRMPQMDGLELAQKIKEINPKQLFLFITAHSDSEYLFDAINLQVDGYLVKPIDFEILEDKLQKLIKIIENERISKELKESETKFRKIAEASQIGIFIYQEYYTFVNDAFCRLTGYTQEELLTMHPWEILEPKYQETIKEISKRRLQGEEFTKEYNDIRIITKDNKDKVFRVNTTTIALDGSFAGMGTMIDITDLVNTKEQLNLLAQAIEQMDEMVRITDKDGKIIYVNNALVQHTGYSKEELIGSNNNIFKSGKHKPECYKVLYDTILQGKIYQNTFINKKKNGEIYYEEQVITPILDKDGNIRHFVSTSKDITDKIAMIKELKNLAAVDSLTQIYNRYKMNIFLDEELIRAKRYKEDFALFILDIDHFKDVNDSHGHDVGDTVLKELAELIQNSIRDSDKFGRWGGEEFVLLIPKISANDAVKVAQKIRKRVEKYEFSVVKNITVSIGVASYKPGDTKEDILKRADDALYESKNNGRNQVTYKA